MDILKPLIALLAIVNPIGVLPFFIHFTARLQPRAAPAHDPRRRGERVHGDRGERESPACASSSSSASRSRSFQVGGGMLLLLSSLQMLNAQPAESRTSDLVEGSDKADAGDSIAIVPLTIPLLTGPATISTMVIYAEKTRHWWEIAILVGYGVVIGAFGLDRVQPVRAGSPASIGKTGINVMTRLMGLILAALAVEVMSDGLVKLFPALVGTSALSEHGRPRSTTTSSAAPAPPAACSPIA